MRIEQLFFFSHLERQLWSLCGSLQGLLTIAGRQHVPLLRKAIRWPKVAKALSMMESVYTKYLAVCTQVKRLYCCIPAVRETEEIHRKGTGIVETSKGCLTQLLISSYDNSLAATMLISTLLQYPHVVFMYLDWI